MKLDGETRAEEHHHLLVTIPLEEREQQEEVALRRTHNVTLQIKFKIHIIPIWNILLTAPRISW